jgi:hypothetical protein
MHYTPSLFLRKEAKKDRGIKEKAWIQRKKEERGREKRRIILRS